MGRALSSAVLGVPDPTVGLLSIGEEPGKGTPQVIEAHRLMSSDPSLRFYGNVEGRDLYTGRADVIVCDGFIGNVALKVSEGMVDVFRHMLQESLSATLTRKLGYLLSRAAYKDFKKRVDYSEYGGAPLLGVKGVVIICHGRSNDNAIRNAIRVACESANEHVNDRIAAEIVRSRAQDGLATSA
jgi:glycerol-3-phosphate acyltransferase PlsX